MVHCWSLSKFSHQHHLLVFEGMKWEVKSIQTAIQLTPENPSWFLSLIYTTVVFKGLLYSFNNYTSRLDFEKKKSSKTNKKKTLNAIGWNSKNNSYVIKRKTPKEYEDNEDTCFCVFVCFFYPKEVQHKLPVNVEGITFVWYQGLGFSAIPWSIDGIEPI